MDDLNARLLRIRALRFEADTDRSDGWRGVGVGAVTVYEPESGVLIFTESGRWRPAQSYETRFHNIYRWTRLPAPVPARRLHGDPDGIRRRPGAGVDDRRAAQGEPDRLPVHGGLRRSGTKDLRRTAGIQALCLRASASARTILTLWNCFSVRWRA